jgi:hypothetical protein
VRSALAASGARKVDCSSVDCRVLYRHTLPAAGFQIRFDPERLTWSFEGYGIVAIWSIPES